MKNFSKILLNSPQRILFDLAQHSNDIVFITDWCRCLLYVNPAACQRLGYTREYLTNQKLSMLYRREVRSAYVAKIYNELRKKGQWTGETELQKQDGTTFWTDTTFISYYDEKGKPAGAIGIGRDLTDEKLLSQHSMHEENRLQEMIEAMEDAVCVCDNKGKILMVNNAHSKMLGRSKEEIVGMAQPYPWIDPVDAGKAKEMFRRVTKEGSVKNIPLTWRRADNKKLIVSVAMSKYASLADGISGQVCTIRDVTNVQYTDELQRANEQVQRLVYDVKQKSLRLRTLEETNALVLHHAGVSAIFHQIIGGVEKLVQHELAGIYVYDPEGQCLNPHTLSKQTAFARLIAKFPVRIGEGIVGEAASSGKMMLVNNAHLDPRSKYPDGKRPECEHVVAVPLQGNDSMFGVLVVGRNRNPEFIEEEAEVIRSFADAVCVALENARMVAQLRQDKGAAAEISDVLGLLKNGKAAKVDRAGNGHDGKSRRKSNIGADIVNPGLARE
ncbi:MAG TPA: PAS domain S-box protein [Bacteroidota bacterium]|jgi:PAS domain S-box-containing protein|nr:PAS domain S-box protein [Bacteroidota bacterium]